MTSFNDPEAFIDPEDAPLVVQAKREVKEIVEYSYGQKEVILYNLSIGATAQELQWTYEADSDFSALPTFGVIPQFLASSTISCDWIPNFNPAKILHGEQYLKIHVPEIPTSGDLITTARFVEVLDKGKASVLKTRMETRDKDTGDLLFENLSTTFVRGVGGFGGRKTAKDAGPSTAANTPPPRNPDAIMEEATSPNQAALYRLNSDMNPLHIDPFFASMGGFDKPILHGLCSMGISGKHVFKKFGGYQDIKVRFAGVVFPGETLVTSMWREGPKIIFETKVKERNTIVLASAGVTLLKEATAKL